MKTYLIFTTEGRFQRIYAETCRSEQGELVFSTRRREVERLVESQVASVHLIEGGPVVRSAVSGTGYAAEVMK